MFLSCASVTQLAKDSYELNGDHGSWPGDGFCRALRMDEINTGDPYTLTVDLFNVDGLLGVNSGHPGVMYNVIDENNFDFVFFRLVP